MKSERIISFSLVLINLFSSGVFAAGREIDTKTKNTKNSSIKKEVLSEKEHVTALSSPEEVSKNKVNNDFYFKTALAISLGIPVAVALGFGVFKLAKFLSGRNKDLERLQTDNPSNYNYQSSDINKFNIIKEFNCLVPNINEFDQDFFEKHKNEFIKIFKSAEFYIEIDNSDDKKGVQINKELHEDIVEIKNFLSNFINEKTENFKDTTTSLTSLPGENNADISESFNFSNWLNINEPKILVDYFKKVIQELSDKVKLNDNKNLKSRIVVQENSLKKVEEYIESGEKIEIKNLKLEILKLHINYYLENLNLCIKSGVDLNFEKKEEKEYFLPGRFSESMIFYKEAKRLEKFYEKFIILVNHCCEGFDDHESKINNNEGSFESLIHELKNILSSKNEFNEIINKFSNLKYVDQSIDVYSNILSIVKFMYEYLHRKQKRSNTLQENNIKKYAGENFFVYEKIGSGGDKIDIAEIFSLLNNNDIELLESNFESLTSSDLKTNKDNVLNRFKNICAKINNNMKSFTNKYSENPKIKLNPISVLFRSGKTLVILAKDNLRRLFAVKFEGPTGSRDDLNKSIQMLKALLNGFDNNEFCYFPGVMDVMFRAKAVSENFKSKTKNGEVFMTIMPYFSGEGKLLKISDLKLAAPGFNKNSSEVESLMYEQIYSVFFLMKIFLKNGMFWSDLKDMNLTLDTSIFGGTVSVIDTGAYHKIAQNKTDSSVIELGFIPHTRGNPLWLRQLFTFGYFSTKDEIFENDNDAKSVFDFLGTFKSCSEIELSFLCLSLMYDLNIANSIRNGRSIVSNTCSFPFIKTLSDETNAVDEIKISLGKSISYFDDLETSSQVKNFLKSTLEKILSAKAKKGASKKIEDCLTVISAALNQEAIGSLTQWEKRFQKVGNDIEKLNPFLKDIAKKLKISVEMIKEAKDYYDKKGSLPLDRNTKINFTAIVLMRLENVYRKFNKLDDKNEDFGYNEMMMIMEKLYKARFDRDIKERANINKFPPLFSGIEDLLPF